MSDSGANHQPWAYYPSNGRDTGDQIPTTRYRSNSNSNGSSNFPQRKKLEVRDLTQSFSKYYDYLLRKNGHGSLCVSKQIKFNYSHTFLICLIFTCNLLA